MGEVDAVEVVVCLLEAEKRVMEIWGGHYFRLIVSSPTTRSTRTIRAATQTISPEVGPIGRGAAGTVAQEGQQQGSRGRE